MARTIASIAIERGQEAIADGADRITAAGQSARGGAEQSLPFLALSWSRRSSNALNIVRVIRVIRVLRVFRVPSSETC